MHPTSDSTFVVFLTKTFDLPTIPVAWAPIRTRTGQGSAGR